MQPESDCSLTCSLTFSLIAPSRSYTCLGPDNVPTAASRFLKGIPAEVLHHTNHFELQNQYQRRDTDGACFAQPRHGGGGGGGAVAGPLSTPSGAPPPATAPFSRAPATASVRGSSAHHGASSQPAERPTGAVGAHLARWQQKHAQEEAERKERKEKEAARKARKAEKEAAMEAEGGGASAAGGGKAKVGSKAAGKARMASPLEGDAPPTKKSKKQAAAHMAAPAKPTAKRNVIPDDDESDDFD